MSFLASKTWIPHHHFPFPRDINDGTDTILTTGVALQLSLSPAPVWRSRVTSIIAIPSRELGPLPLILLTTAAACMALDSELAAELLCTVRMLRKSVLYPVLG